MHHMASKGQKRIDVQISWDSAEARAIPCPTPSWLPEAPVQLLVAALPSVCLEKYVPDCHPRKKMGVQVVVLTGHADSILGLALLGLRFVCFSGGSTTFRLWRAGCQRWARQRRLKPSDRSTPLLEPHWSAFPGKALAQAPHYTTAALYKARRELGDPDPSWHGCRVLQQADCLKASRS